MVLWMSLPLGHPLLCHTGFCSHTKRKCVCYAVAKATTWSSQSEVAFIILCIKFCFGSLGIAKSHALLSKAEDQ